MRKRTMYKGSQMKPVFIRIVLSDCFRRLQQMLDLWLIKIGITLVDKLIQQLAAFPYAHLHSVQFAILLCHSLYLRTQSQIEKRKKKSVSLNNEVVWKFKWFNIQIRRFGECGSSCKNLSRSSSSPTQHHSSCHFLHGRVILYPK